MKNDKLEMFEVWAVEHPAVDGSLKVFGADKDAAKVYARELGPDSGMWDMMASPTKENYGDPKEKA